MIQLNHRHMIVNCEGIRNPPSVGSESLIEDWMTRLVEAVKMNILIPPKAIYLDKEGNEGVTGICCIETSHTSIHVWEKLNPSIIRFDLYSCADFEADTVIELLKEFNPWKISYLIVDRNNDCLVEEQKVVYFGDKP